MDAIVEIRKTTASVEAKLSTLITRLDDVEKRVEFLEGAEKELKANPLKSSWTSYGIKWKIWKTRADATISVSSEYLKAKKARTWPRPILARFRRSTDRDFVLRVARIKGNLSWENNNIMVLPDLPDS
ncbi:hypothetical protein QQF64_012023 [Cirrhinus molitorella]|uniref:Uncharacterized protein n=1 Tax=Cirrhinus molitorella TaxID=172907 RepID=A0ABR3LU97_9TELE